MCCREDRNGRISVGQDLSYPTNIMINKKVNDMCDQGIEVVKWEIIRSRRNIREKYAKQTSD